MRAFSMSEVAPVKILFRFPTLTKKPFNSVSRARCQPSFGLGSCAIVLSVRRIRMSAMSRVRQTKTVFKQF